MIFLYPQFLLGLFAILIPIAIHLFNLQRPKKVFFTNVRFLKSVQQQASSKVKLKHLLILLARILFITFLVLAFARPVIPTDDGREQNPFVAFYLDNSLSMENTLETGTALATGRNLVEKVERSYPRNTKHLFLTNDFYGRDQFLRNGDRLRERLAETNVSYIARTAEAVAQRLQSTLSQQTAGQQADVFVFSDFQKSTLGGAESLVADTSNTYFLVPLVNPQTSNVYVDSVRLQMPYIKIGEKNTLNVRFFNSGTERVEHLNVKLIIDGDQVATAGIDIEPNTYTTADFSFALNAGGTKRCKVVFEDYPVTFDNEYYFVLKVAPQVNIVHLHQQSRNYIPNLYANESIFDLNSYELGSVDYNRLTEADLVVADNLSEPEEGVLEGLRTVLEAGGSVAVFPSGKLDPEVYRSLLKQLDAPMVTLNPTDSLVPGPGNKLQPPDINDPFFANVFDRMDLRVDMPHAVPLLRLRNVGNPLLKFKDGSPFLTSFDLLNGKVYLFAAPLDNRYSTFQKHAIFVPVLYKIAFNSLNINEKIAYTFNDEFLAVSVKEPEGEQVYRLRKEETDRIPPQRMMGRTLLMELSEDVSENMPVGFYEVVAGDRVEDVVALNYDKRESQMDFYTAEELRNSFAGHENVTVIEEFNEDSFVRRLEEANLGVSLWRYALILCLMFLLAEIAIIRFFRQ